MSILVPDPMCLVAGSLGRARVRAWLFRSLLG
jgi:hypothetical protein